MTFIYLYIRYLYVICERIFSDGSPPLDYHLIWRRTTIDRNIHYLNNHPAGIQQVSLNPAQLNFNLEPKNIFTGPMLEMVWLMPRYFDEQEKNEERQNEIEWNKWQHSLEQERKKERKGYRYWWFFIMIIWTRLFDKIATPYNGN